jgi:hypothetical protein
VAVQLSPNGKWVYGSAPQGGTSAVLANTIIAIREELVGPNSQPGTWVSTSQGVSALFDGAQAMAVYNIIKDMAIVM